MGKLVILAAPIMDSMIANPIPTRAEVADISLAITQGVDALMLGGETALGEFFVEATQTMGQIALVAERNQDPYRDYIHLRKFFFDNNKIDNCIRKRWQRK